MKKIFYYILILSIMIEVIPFTVVSANSNAVDAVDSFRVTHVYDPNLIYIEWINGNPDIAGTGELISGEQVRFYMDWSVKESEAINTGDYFTFTFPDVLDHSRIELKNNIDITHPDDGTVMAQYSVRESNGKKELNITFTEGVTGRENIAGKYELVMFTGEFETKTETPVTFEINGNTVSINGGITGNPAPPPSYVSREDAKWGGRASLEQVIDGHYYFKWTIWLNFNFDTIDNFLITDMIPSNSPHTLITPQTMADTGVNVPDHLYHITVREYTGADGLQYANARYNQFQEHINNIGGWYENYMAQYTFDSASLTSSPEPLDGIDSGTGMNLNNFTFSSDGKEFSANLGKVTRPVVIDYYTITTQPFSANAFYDDATASAMKNSVVLNGNATKSDHIYSIWVDESASIGGVYGNYSFSVKKTDEDNIGLAGALLALYTSPDCEGTADRIAQSEYDGTVTFGNLKTGIYYIREVQPPDGYILNDTIYQVELNNAAYIISAPDDSVITEIINYTTMPTEEETEAETEEETEGETEEESGKTLPYYPPAEITTEPAITPTETITTTVPNDDIDIEDTTAATTEPVTYPTTEAVTESITEPITAVELPFVEEEIITVPGLPDGYTIQQIDDDLYEIYDDGGIPLGGMTVPDGESIDDLSYEDIIENIIPLEEPDLPEETAENLQTPDVQPEINPKTSDLTWMIPLILILFSLTSLLLIYKKNYN